jgi:hypothetical protein
MTIFPFSQSVVTHNFTFRHEHLPHALPTEMIFRLIPSRSERLIIRDDSTGLASDTLEIIIKWLQVSVVNTSDSDKRPKILFVYRDLVPSD